MNMEMTVSSSQGRPAEWHDTITKDGQRLTGVPKNADAALAAENEHWIGEEHQTDKDRFNEVFEEAVANFNAKQTRADRKMGPESSKPERQKSYYDGVMDGTFCFGTGKQQETAVQETVLQVGNKDDNGVTDSSFDPEHWKELKASGREAEASEYALQHLSRSPNKERMKRVLRRAVERIRDLDPEHLIVLRADYHGDEPCGTGHVHLAYTLRATGYKTGMDSRVASVKALEQMGFEKTAETEYGIVQLHERFREIVSEEMAADALEYGYVAIERKAESGEHRAHSDVETFRQMAAQKEELEKRTQQQEAIQKKLDRQDKQGKRLVRFLYDFMEDLTGDRPKFRTYGEAGIALRKAVEDFKEATEETARQKAQEAAEKEFQRREDALEAQKAVLGELEEVTGQLRKIADTDVSRKRFMEANRVKGGTTLEEVYQKAIREKQARTEAIIQSAMELAAKYDRMQRQDNRMELG